MTTTVAETTTQPERLNDGTDAVISALLQFVHTFVETGQNWMFDRRLWNPREPDKNAI